MPEFQDEIVMADHAVGLEAAIHFGEVDGALAFVDLHGIPAAQRDMRAAFAGEMYEIPLPAGAAAGARLRRGNFRVLVGPDVERKQSPSHRRRSFSLTRDRRRNFKLPPHRGRSFNLLLGGAAFQGCDSGFLWKLGFSP